MKNKNILKLYIKNNWITIFLSLIISAISVISYLSIPIIIGKIIDNFDKLNLLNLFILLIICILIYVISNYISNILIKRMNVKATTNLRKEFIEKINFSKISILDRYNSGDISSRIINDIDTISDGFSNLILKSINAIFTIIIIFTIMFKLNKFLTIILLLFIPVFVFIPYYISKKTKVYFRKNQIIESKINSYVKEKINNFSYIKLNFCEEKTINDFLSLANEYELLSKRAVLFSSLANPTSRFINGIATIIVCFVGGVFAIDNVITIGTYQIFINYATQFVKPFNEISNITSEITNSLTSLERINEIFNFDVEKENGDKIKKINSDIIFNNVIFSYNKDNKIIKNLNCKIEYGKKTAIVGTTGSGKTTLINLLMRFYNIDSGSIYINNSNIDSYNLASYRNNFGIVPQDTYLFKDTVLENLKYGCNRKIDTEEIIRICKLVNCHNFIEKMPNKYETILLPDCISTGQKQLICIARMILRNPDILILDEATSDIDTLTEKNIQNALNILMKNKTSIIIAHRLSTIVNADKIIVMNNGVIVEEGNHQELLEKKKYYYDIYNSQFL